MSGYLSHLGWFDYAIAVLAVVAWVVALSLGGRAR